ncbi:MAG TPA: hypothetical protein VNX29_16135 [Kaistia sp.]|nr:hypothetical protein [Kaistia sp.]
MAEAKSIVPLSPTMMSAAGSELCQVYCNGQIFEGWTDVSVVPGFNDVATRFRLSVTEPTSAAGQVLGWQIRPDDPIQIKLGGVQVVNGYVDVRQAAYDAGSHGVEIAGRSITALAVDAAAVTDEGKPVGPFAGYKLDEIARALLDPLSIGLKVLGDIGAPFPNVTAQFGESIFELLARLARLRGFHLHDDPDGDLVLSNQLPTSDASVGLIEGVNILSASAMVDLSSQTDKIIVVGQMPGNDDAYGAAVANQTASVTNDKAKRRRQKVIIMEEPGDKEDMKTRANLEMAQLVKGQAKVQVSVQGWFKADGSLWAIADVVKLNSAMLLIDDHLAVEAIEFVQSDSEGTLTRLDLVPPASLLSVPPAGKASPPLTMDGGDAPDDEDNDDTAAIDWNARSGAAAV